MMVTSLTSKGANLYLTESDSDIHDERYYFISDGVYTNADGESGTSLGDYTNATYSIHVRLAVPGGTDFTPGEFPQYWSFVGVDGESNISYIDVETSADGTEEISLESPEESDNEPVVVSGGFDDGETMKLSFDGTLTLHHFDGKNWVYEDVAGKFYFTGTVQDERVF